MSAILVEGSAVFLAVIVHDVIGSEVQNLSNESKAMQIWGCLQSYLEGVILFCGTAFLKF